MKEQGLSNSINTLNINKSVITILNNNKIYTIKDLWLLKRKDLKKFGLRDSDINNVIIKLQLYGIDINKKIYNRD